jgi:hypothetical protein
VAGGSTPPGHKNVFRNSLSDVAQWYRLRLRKWEIWYRDNLEVDDLEVDDLEVNNLEVDDLEVDNLEVDNLEVDNLEVDILEVDNKT